MLKSVLSISLGFQLMGRIAHTAEDPKRLRPQVGDIFIFPLGDHQGQVITPQDLPVGGPPVLVYPTDPTTQTLRNGSRLNRVLLVRLAQEDLTEPTRAVAAEGVVGYSAICPHTGCDVIGWENDVKHLVCPCHSSAFDPKDRARVMGGPAPRALAALPLWITDGKLTVAGPFSGRVGFQQQ
jgi:Rieske Fe-S protein